MTASALPPIIASFAPSDMGFLRMNAALSAGAKDGIHDATAGVAAEIGNILGAAERIDGIFTVVVLEGTVCGANRGDGGLSRADGADGVRAAWAEIDGVFVAFGGIGGVRVADGIGGGVA